MKSRLLSLSLPMVPCFYLSAAAQDLSQNADTFLKSGDRVSVVLWRFDDTNHFRSGMTHGSVPIVEGKLKVPLLGEVQAAGLTVDELRQVLQGRYAKRLNERHEVSITVGQAEGFKFKFLPPQSRQPKWIPLAPVDHQSPRVYP